MSADWSGHWDGSVLPQSDSPAWTRSQSGFYVDVESVSGGALHLHTAFDAVECYYYRDNAGSDHNHVDATCRLKRVTGGDNDTYFGVRVAGKFSCSATLLNDTTVKVYNVDSSGVAQTATFTVTSTTDTYHDLRIVYSQADGNVKVYWDGTLKYTYSGSMWTANTQTRVLFGDATTSSNGVVSDAYYDDVTFAFTTVAATYVTLTPATESDSAVALTQAPHYTLTPATETDIAIAPVPRPSTVARVRSGLVSDTEWPDTLSGTPGWLTNGTVNGAFSGADDARTIGTSATGDLDGGKRTVDLGHSGFESTTDLQLNTDWAISVDVHAGGANNAYSGVVAAEDDTSNYYALRVSKTNGGTSSLVEVTAGTPATRASATADIHTGTGRVKLYRKNDRWGAVVGGQHFYYDDASPPTAPFWPIFGAPASAGTSSYQYDDVCICCGNTVEVAGLESGEAARIYDASGTLIASAVESSGVATLDLSDQAFPFVGFVKVFTDNTYATMRATDARFPRDGTTNFYGGDRLWSQFGTSTGTVGLKVVTNDGHSNYATVQYNSRSGIIHDDQMFGLVQGKRGKVYAYRLDLRTGQTLDYVYVGNCADQHGTIDMTQDANGHLHILYGGTYPNVYRTEDHTYHQVSSRPWDVTAWQTRTDMGNFLGTLTLDSLGNVHMVGMEFSLSVGHAVKHRIWSGGSWGSATTVITDNGWENYVCDVRPNVDRTRFHVVGYSYCVGTPQWKNAWHLYYDVAAGLWKKLDGTTVTLPATQNSTTGVIAAIDTVQSGDAYVPIVAVDPNGDVWMIVPSNASTGQRTQYLYKGTLGGSWSSSLHTFEYVRTKGCMAFTGDGSGLVFIAPASKTSALETPWDLRRWTSEDGTATDGSTTWRETVMYDGGELDGGAHYWPRMAVVDDSDYFKVIWHSRYSLYGNGLASGTALSAMDGVSTVFVADVGARLSIIPATETDAAVALGVARGYSLTPATETDAAQALDFYLDAGQLISLTPATEMDSAVALTVSSGVHQVTLTPAVETDAAVALSLNVLAPIYVDLTAALEEDVAVALSLQGVFAMNLAEFVPGTVVGAYLAHEWIGTLVPQRRAGSYPGEVVQEQTIAADGTVTFRLSPGEYVAWMEDYPLRRRFFKVTEEDS